MRHDVPRLDKLQILLADADLYMATIVAHMLHTAGFTNITRVANGQRALEILETKHIDILITEWNMDGADGLDLAMYLRSPERSPNLTLPIIMMTGRAERHDVFMARDFGITEFLVKPVSVAMLFDRMRRVIEHPRDFVIASGYVGPDRRHRTSPSHANSNEQRTARPMFISNASAEVVGHDGPVIISKTFELKRKANIIDNMTNILTPELMAKAQAVITSYQDESQKWVKNDIDELDAALSRLMGDMPGASQQVQRAALSIKSRAGMFGYDMLTNVAFALYVFMYHDFVPRNATHLLIVQKHIDAIKVLLVGDKLGNTPEMEEELVNELLRMTAKLKVMRDTPRLASAIRKTMGISEPTNLAE